MRKECPTDPLGIIPKSVGVGFPGNTYTCPNGQQEGTIWFHDHALGLTRLNVYPDPCRQTGLEFIQPLFHSRDGRYSLLWTGLYEAMARVKERLSVIVPLTLFLIFLLLYINTRFLAKTFIVVLAVPFSAIGAVWLVYLLGYNMSIAVWVGLIALLGVDAETGVFMLLYLDLAYERAKKEGPPAQPRGVTAGGSRRGRQAVAAEIHDGRDDGVRTGSDHVVDRCRFGHYEKDRRTDDRRHLYLVYP